MKAINKRRGVGEFLILPAAVLSFVSAAPAVGAYPEIHAAWDGGGTPIQNQDYFVSTDGPGGPDFPDVELVTGNLTWRIWSTDTDNPDDIGDIGIVSSPHPQDFGVKIEDDQADPGARQVKGITLDPQGEGSDAKYSRITGGEITGDLTGKLTLQESSGGTGGDITGLFTVNGDVSGDIDVAVLSGNLWIFGDLSGDITVSDRMEDTWMLVDGSVASTARIVINEMTGSWITLAIESSARFAGHLVLGNGVPDGCRINIFRSSTLTAMIDLNSYPVAGWLGMFDGGGVTIVNGGTVTGTVRLGSGDTSTFSGSASFLGVGQGGSIMLEYFANLGGTIALTGGVEAEGEIHVDGNVLSGAKIKVGGSVAGSVTIGVGFLNGNVAGDIDIDGEMTGTIAVNLALESTGRILIDGLCDGAITIGWGTESLSLIRITEGVGSSGKITINDTEGPYDAHGLIHVGEPMGPWQGGTPPVTFDGSIVLEQGDPDGGDLEGIIRVVGCHETDDDLDICICGDGEENITIIQPDCEHQVEVSCGSGCD